MWSVSSPPLGSRASVPAAARGRTPLMAPKRAQARAKPVARRRAAAKRAAQVTTSNVRKQACGGLGDPREEQRQSERELLKSSVREEEGYADHCAVVVVTYLPPAGLLGNLCTLQ